MKKHIIISLSIGTLIGLAIILGKELKYRTPTDSTLDISDIDVTPINSL